MKAAARVLFVAIASAAACAPSYDDAESPPADGGVTSDASDADGSALDASTDDAGLDANDAGSDGSSIPSGMVVVTTAAKSFAIDAREVTAAEFSAFKEKVVQTAGGDAGFPAACAFKSGLGPNTGCAATTAPGLPVNCVDWCDAFAYCRDRGKRLCGSIAGGTVPAGKDVDTSYSQWVRACAGGTAASVYPYGAADTTKCNVNGAMLHDTGSYPECEGSVPGLFDMSGNVAEIDDSCVGDGGEGDMCFWHGGSAADSVGAARCDSAKGKLRQEYDALTGFRCCKDL